MLLFSRPLCTQVWFQGTTSTHGGLPEAAPVTKAVPLNKIAIISFCQNGGGVANGVSPCRAGLSSAGHSLQRSLRRLCPCYLLEVSRDIQPHPLEVLRDSCIPKHG